MDDIEWKISKDLVDYKYCAKFMEERALKIINNQAKQLIWLLEHDHVITAGISAKDSDLKLTNSNINIIQTNRGGKYTYHGPGMQIIYIMIDIKKLFYPNKPDIAKFVEFLEQWIIEFLLNFKIKGEIRKDRVGIWVKSNEKEEKIAAIGIKVKKWVSYHGVAININPDLTKFNNIVPCGISEYGITSLEKLNIKYDNIHDLLKESFYQNLLKFKS